MDTYLLLTLPVDTEGTDAEVVCVGYRSVLRVVTFAVSRINDLLSESFYKAKPADPQHLGDAT